jgi:TonB family protein
MLSFRRPWALSLAILMHACVILALLRNGNTVARAGREQVISLLPMETSAAWIAPSPLPTRLARPDAATVDAPKIAIEEHTPANDAVSNGKMHDMHLPPRLDPQASNAAPELTADLRNRLGSGQAYIVIVRILVLESGMVGNAEIAASSGFARLDALALAQVRDHWRFLPATSNGKAARDWLSVEVLFRPA